MLRRTLVKLAIAGAVVAALAALLFVQAPPGGIGGRIIYKWNTVRSGDKPAADATGPTVLINITGTENNRVQESGFTDMPGGITDISSGEGDSSGPDGAYLSGPDGADLSPRIDTAIPSPGNDSPGNSGTSTSLEDTPDQIPPDLSVPEFPTVGLPVTMLTLLAGAVVLGRRRH